MTFLIVVLCIVALAMVGVVATGRLRALGSLLVHCHNVILNGKSYPRWFAGLVFGILPPVVWTLSFKMARNIPDEWRPKINTVLLPRLEHALLSPTGILFFTIALVPLALLLRDRSVGMSRSAWLVLLFPAWLKFLNAVALGTTFNAFQDVLAWLFYGVAHFASPFVAGWWIWGFGSPSAALAFGWCLGLQNFTGLCIHILFPNAAPWYKDLYDASVVPDYNFPGSAAGLVRVDAVLGTHLYTKAFQKSPVVFGALPSLHAATATCCCFFVLRYGGRVGRVFAFVYCSFMFWSTMYLHHHYAIDLVAGSALSLFYFSLMSHFVLRRIDATHEREGSTRGIDRLLCRPGPYASNGTGYRPVAARSSMDVREEAQEAQQSSWGLDVLQTKPGRSARPSMLPAVSEKDELAHHTSSSASASDASFSGDRQDGAGSSADSSSSQEWA